MLGIAKRLMKGYLAMGRLEAKSEKFRELFLSGARLEQVADGCSFTEGPVWFAENSSLLFSDIPTSRILRLGPEGKVEVWREPSGRANGLTRDRAGCLIVCEHDRRVTRTEQDGSITVLADRHGGRRLNSPNDVVVKRDGAIYFTDPPYGIKAHEQEQPVQGVYRLSPDGADLTLVADDFVKPNGLAFSPDEMRLYIDDSSDRSHIRVFEVDTDGRLSGGRVFHDLKSKRPGSPDGMKVDTMGNVYCTGPGGVWVIDPGGKHLGTIVTPEVPSNCAWGGDDWRSLYITAQSSVYRIRVNTQGISLP